MEKLKANKFKKPKQISNSDSFFQGSSLMPLNNLGIAKEAISQEKVFVCHN